MCEHKNFTGCVNVNKLEDIGRFCADITISCEDCGVPFRFIGLPCGLDINGASVSVGGTEAHLAIAPKGEVVTPLDERGTHGFTIRRE